MKKILALTKDIPGERDFLRDHYSDYNMAETYGSGRWDEINPNSTLYELPYTDEWVSPDDATVTKILFDHGDINDSRWHLADALTSNMQFSSYTHGTEHEMTFTFGRCGSQFLEEALLLKWKEYQRHYTNKSPAENLEFISRISDPSLVTGVLIYHHDWWRWIVSTKISHTYGFYHHYNEPDWEQFDKIEITDNDLNWLNETYINMWNFWCNLRSLLPKHKFYLTRMDNNLREFRDTVAHKKLKYNEHDMILNHDEAKQKFESQYLHDWQTYERRCVNHLLQMRCTNGITKEDITV